MLYFFFITVLKFEFFVFFFFFQAEDGIRDADVTGVQTCALPISLVAQDPPGRPRPLGARREQPRGCRPGVFDELNECGSECPPGAMPDEWLLADAGEQEAQSEDRKSVV